MNRNGSCLCGAVKFTASDIDPELHACHCGQCRRWSGGPNLSVNVGSLTFQDDSTLKVFDSSDWAERGFCSECGSNLFYRLKEPNQYILCMGALDDASGLSLAGEIFIDDKPECYDFAGAHPRLTGAEFLASLGAPG